MAVREGGGRRDGLAVALAIVLVAFLLIGSIAVVLAAVREHEDADVSEREATELVKTDLGATTDELVAVLVGAGTIVEDDRFGVGSNAGGASPPRRPTHPSSRRSVSR